METTIFQSSMNEDSKYICNKCKDTGIKTIGWVTKKLVPCDCEFGKIVQMAQDNPNASFNPKVKWSLINH